MSARMTVVVAPARSGKTESLLAVYRRALAGRGDGRSAVGRTLWLAPSIRAAEHIRDRLLCDELPACFSPGILTFNQLADRILAHAEREIRPIDARMKRLLVERLIDEAHEAGRLKHFGAIADTPGLADLAAEFISELKQVEIWPEEFRDACRKGGEFAGPRGRLRQKDRELLDLYEAYQQLLVDHDLFDDEGRFWSARALLQAGQAKPLEYLTTVVIEGFTDFTRTQHEIIGELAKRSDEIYISLPGETETDRDDLFTKPRATLERLRRDHPQLVVERIARRDPPHWAAVDHIERELFKNPRVVRTTADAKGVEIIAAAGAVAEIEEIARRVKRLLTAGDDLGRPVRPDDVALVFRSPGEVADLVAEVFGRYGLPFALESGRRLDRSPSLAALVALAELDADDWPFRRLLSVLGSNFFRPKWPEWRQPGAAEAVERTVRHLQVPSGREALLAAVERVAQSAMREVVAGDPGAEAAERHNRRRTDALKALPVLRRLAAAFDQLPAEASAVGWWESLEALAKDTGLWAALHEVDELPKVLPVELNLSADRAAWARFERALRSGDDLATLLNEPPRPIRRRDLLEHLKSLIRSEQLPGDRDETGRIRVLSAITARSLAIPYLFVGGLTERAFPSPERGDRLYGEAEYRELAKLGLPLTSAFERQRDEMLLFYETVVRAARRLWLSYSALNEKAEPLLPSPFLAELERLFEPGTLKRSEASDLSPIPPADVPLNRLDVRIRAVVDAAEGSTDLLAAVVRGCGESAANLLSGLAIVEARSTGDGFGPYEGMIVDRRAIARVAKRFDDDFPWSAGQLEQYGACPFQFYLDRVLHLQPPEEVALEIDYRRRGSRLHQAMVRLHEAVNRELGGASSPCRLPPTEYEALVDRVLDADTGGEDDHPLAAAFHAIDRRLLRRRLIDYVDQHRRYEEAYKHVEPAVPKHFEVSFGMPEPPDDGVSSSEPLELEMEGGTIRIAGRIDRLDVGVAAGRAVFTVVDYKTGGATGYTKRHVVEGRALQLTLYAVAAQKLLAATDAVPWQFGYWFLAESGFKRTLALHEIVDGVVVPTDDWADLKQRIVARVFELVRSVRRGEFPPASADEHCTSRCDFRTVCRVAQVRALEKTWPSPPKTA